MNRAMRVARLLALLAALTFAVSAAAQSVHLPPHEKVVLKNGLTLLLLPKPGVPLVSTEAIIKGGAAADPVGQAGLASLAAGLLRKGTTTRTAQQFAADLDFIGGSLDAGASSDYSAVTTECLAKDLPAGLGLFSDALLHPIFPQEQVAKLIAQGIDGVKAAKDDPQSVLGAYYNGYLFGATPYGRPEGGDEVSLKNIQRAAIVKYYDSFYVPGNTIVAIAGDFDATALKPQLEAIFGAWPVKTAPAVSVVDVPRPAGRRLLLIDKPDATQTYFAIGNIGVSATNPDRVAIRVVNTVFGGRFTSMLNEALRVESGLTYGAFSFFGAHRSPGPFLMESFTKTATTAKALDLALEVLAKLHKEGVTPEQLASAKSYLKGQFPPTVETSSQLAHRIAIDEFYGLDDSEVNDFAARVDAVTPEVARRVIEKYFPLDNLVFVLIGNAADVKPVAAKYAPRQDARSIAAPGFWPPTR
jgi:predicted Zn-dependent peptidase